MSPHHRSIRLHGLLAGLGEERQAKGGDAPFEDLDEIRPLAHAVNAASLGEALEKGISSLREALAPQGLEPRMVTIPAPGSLTPKRNVLPDFER